MAARHDARLLGNKKACDQSPILAGKPGLFGVGFLTVCSRSVFTLTGHTCIFKSQRKRIGRPSPHTGGGVFSFFRALIIFIEVVA